MPGVVSSVLYRRPGFTLVEVIFVLTTMGMLSAIAMPRFSGFMVRQRVEAAKRRIEVDLAFAQRRARYTGTSQAVIFNLIDENYRMPGITDPDHPAVDYQVELADEPYGVEIVSASFGLGKTVTYDGYGKPDLGGTVVISVGANLKTITVDGPAAAIAIPTIN